MIRCVWELKFVLLSAVDGDITYLRNFGTSLTKHIEDNTQLQIKHSGILIEFIFRFYKPECIIFILCFTGLSTLNTNFLLIRYAVQGLIQT